MPHPGLRHPESLPLQQTFADPYLLRGHSNTVLAQSLWVPASWCAQGLLEPSEHLWWEWGLILNVNSPLLPSCWGFSFGPGHQVSPHSHSSTAQPPLQHLPSFQDIADLDVGFLLRTTSAPRSHCY